MKAAAIFGLRASWKDVEPFSRATGIITQAGTPPAKADAVLIFGGDGTVHRHLAKLVEHQVPTLVVPGGSGNDFARAIGITRVEDAIAAWRRFARDGSNVRTIDVGVVSAAETTSTAETRKYGEFEKTSTSLKERAVDASRSIWRAARGTPGPQRETHLFCCVGGTGFDAETNRRANAMPWWLRANGGYVIAAARTLATWKPVQMRIDLPERGVTLDEATSFVVFANAPSYGSGMKIAPRAQLDDGLLDVCFVRGTSKRRIISNFASIYSGSHLSLREVEYFQVSRLRIETDVPMDVYADGEFVCRTPIDVTVQPQALRVIV